MTSACVRAQGIECLEARKSILDDVSPTSTATRRSHPERAVRSRLLPDWSRFRHAAERDVVRRPRRPSAATLLLFWAGLLSPPARADVSPSLQCHAGTVLV